MLQQLLIDARRYDVHFQVNMELQRSLLVI